MSQHRIEDEEEDKPLDPAVELVRRRMLRLQVVSALIMIVSLMAVFGAILYKVMSRPDEASVAERGGAIVPADAPRALTANLPRGFEIADISYGDGQALIYGTKENGEQTLYLFDINTGRMAADVEIRFD
ncbi:MAG: hypothetical protein CMH13_02375 [Martelella sp.]|uniref:hypothetical protein n=1 Tax=unclassified Martelella TaxID=2629616 RepID=UPI000C4FDD77|nr:hypothetical protein [Martelella sp.]MAU19289.1 hypothetical protein [Martelella sp.]MAU19361.1 hypothetical protein [Martelella sp.]|tara:strand:+ start:205 stop:594 length:390 start_codon:yes stop_codon:yes gene_type:complete